MGKLIPGKNGGKINQWQKGESGNPKGRPRKPVLQMKVEGYKLHEINDTIQAMVSMTLEELKFIYESPKSTVLEKTIAGALRKSIDKGNLDSIETLMNRVYGKPNEKIDVTTGGDKLNKPNFEIKIITNGEDNDKQVK